jgi:cellulose biosynthesis protein BcsQ
MRTIALFNNKGGVGKTSLVYHLAWMLKELQLKVVAVDLDPQANLSTFFLDEDVIERVWQSSEVTTVWEAITPLRRGVGDIAPLRYEHIDDAIALIPGDLQLSGYEDDLATNWTKSLEGDERAFRVLTAFARIVGRVGEATTADVALIDLGPNLGAINRAALIACDHVVLPLGPDLFSLQGLRNVGPALKRWRQEWQRRREQAPADLVTPEGSMRPAGYVMMRRAVRLDRPVKAYEHWIGKVPEVYRSEVLAEPVPDGLTIDADEHCLAQLKDYRSLMPMAQEARKPMFLLKPGDGAIGGHQAAVTACYADFKALARKIAERCGIAVPA